MSVASIRTQPCFGLVHFLVDGSTAISIAGKKSKGCGTFGCVITLGHVAVGMELTALFRGACVGVMAFIDPS